MATKLVSSTQHPSYIIPGGDEICCAAPRWGDPGFPLMFLFFTQFAVNLYEFVFINACTCYMFQF